MNEMILLLFTQGWLNCHKALHDNPKLQTVSKQTIWEYLRLLPSFSFFPLQMVIPLPLSFQSRDRMMLNAWKMKCKHYDLYALSWMRLLVIQFPSPLASCQTRTLHLSGDPGHYPSIYTSSPQYFRVMFCHNPHELASNLWNRSTLREEPFDEFAWSWHALLTCKLLLFLLFRYK